MTIFNTRDIGFAVQDFLDGRLICHFEEDRIIRESSTEITEIDISDPNNPTIHLGNGQQFICRIFAA